MLYLDFDKTCRCELLSTGRKVLDLTKTADNTLNKDRCAKKLKVKMSTPSTCISFLLQFEVFCNYNWFTKYLQIIYLLSRPIMNVWWIYIPKIYSSSLDYEKAAFYDRCRPSPLKLLIFLLRYICGFRFTHASIE